VDRAADKAVAIGLATGALACFRHMVSNW
jgi:hypothetical protein